MGLTQAQVLFFVEHGYLILPGFMDATLCAAARDVLWRGNRSCRLDRADPSTWVGPFAPADETSDPAQLFVNGRRGFRWHYGECGGEPAVMDALPRAVLPLVEQLLGAGQTARPAASPAVPEQGERVWMPKWSRGIYCTLPGAPHRQPGTNGVHTDSHPLHIGAVGYIDDCAPGGGAYSVWPGSHREFFPTFEYQYSQRRPEGRWSGQWNERLGSPEYIATLKCVKSRAPVECCGPTGTVVLWHGRLGHEAAPNFRGSRIRQAILYDFSREDMQAMDSKPPSASMWRDWSKEVQQLAAEHALDCGVTRSAVAGKL